MKFEGWTEEIGTDDDTQEVIRFTVTKREFEMASESFMENYLVLRSLYGEGFKRTKEVKWILEQFERFSVDVWGELRRYFDIELVKTEDELQNEIDEKTICRISEIF